LHSAALLIEPAVRHGTDTHRCISSAIKTPRATEQLHNREPTTARQPHAIMQTTLLHTVINCLKMLLEPKLSIAHGHKVEAKPLCHLAATHHGALQYYILRQLQHSL
jgi:hypothetical protein